MSKITTNPPLFLRSLKQGGFSCEFPDISAISALNKGGLVAKGGLVVRNYTDAKQSECETAGPLIIYRILPDSYQIPVRFIEYL